MIKALITESKPYNIPNINNSFQKMYASTEDYIITICLTWMIMIGFFIMLTTEIMLLIGLAFPVLIILLFNLLLLSDSFFLAIIYLFDYCIQTFLRHIVR